MISHRQLNRRGAGTDLSEKIDQNDTIVSSDIRQLKDQMGKLPREGGPYVDQVETIKTKQAQKTNKNR